MAGGNRPPPTSEGISRSMRSNRGEGTGPELAVRRMLREAGYPGYRLNWPKAPGRPDVCYPGRKVAVFVNGCFWHRCPRCAPSMPKSHREYWEDKFRRNVERDARELEELRADGWTAVVVWECEIRDDPAGVAGRLVRALEGRDVRDPPPPRFRGPPARFAPDRPESKMLAKTFI